VAATPKQRAVAAAILRDGGNNQQAADAAGVKIRTIIRWKREDALPDPVTLPSTPQAVLEALLNDPSPKIRLDAAYRLATLDLDDAEAPDYSRVELLEDLPPGAEPYSVLTVHRAPQE
jgi:hypothetical protein